MQRILKTASDLVESSPNESKSRIGRRAPCPFDPPSTQKATQGCPGLKTVFPCRNEVLLECYWGCEASTNITTPLPPLDWPTPSMGSVHVVNLDTMIHSSATCKHNSSTAPHCTECDTGSETNAGHTKDFLLPFVLFCFRLSSFLAFLIHHRRPHFHKAMRGIVANTRSRPWPRMSRVRPGQSKSSLTRGRPSSCLERLLKRPVAARGRLRWGP